MKNYYGIYWSPTNYAIEEWYKLVKTKTKFTMNQILVLTIININFQ